MLTKIVAFELVDDFVLRLQFNDGSFGTHDFVGLTSKPGTMVAPLKDPAYFARVFLEYGALTWPNGFDIAPEWLRREMAGASELAPAAAE